MVHGQGPECLALEQPRCPLEGEQLLPDPCRIGVMALTASR